MLEYYIMRIIQKLPTAEVVILSLLSEGEKYGYAINEDIKYRGIRNWTDIGFQLWQEYYGLFRSRNSAQFITIYRIHVALVGHRLVKGG